MRCVFLNTCEEKNLCVQKNSADFCTSAYVSTMNNIQYSPSKKVKRFRSAFTTDQVNYLEQQFKKFPYVGNAHRKEVATALKITERAVKIWFQNRRMKEKKESGIKEFDDGRSNRKPVEFAKDQLHNVSASANDQQYSLPMLTEIKKPIAIKALITNNSFSAIKQPTESVGAQYYRKSHDAMIHPARFAEKPLPSHHKGSGEFSINLCKKYKRGLLNNAGPVQVKPISQVALTDEQILPEDLSSKRKSNVSAVPMQAAGTSRNVPNAGYFSVIPTISPLYAQPYMTPDGMLWKPITVMPVVSSGSSTVPAPNNQSGIAPSTLGSPKINCHCDCHIKPHVSVAMRQSTPNTQYIMTALPFNSTSAKF